EAQKYIARLRPVHAVEADIYQARLQLRQGHVADAGASLERAFTGAQADPWPLPTVLQRGLDLAVDVADRDKAAGERLWRVLGTPFAVHLQNDHRIQTRALLAWA